MTGIDKTHKKKRSIERKIAFVLAVLLVILSVITAFRHSGIFQSDDDPAQVSAVKQDDQKDDSEDESAEKAVPKAIEKKEQKIAEKPAEKTEAKDGNVYSYVAKAGDSYTVLARAAVSDYVKEKQLEVSDADRLAAEITLTNDAESPLLEIDQKVEIKKDAVAAALPTSDKQKETAPVEENKDEEKSSDSEKSDDANQAKDFSQAAKAGDSYITIARTAVAKTLEANGEKLSAAQKVAAETYLADAAQFPEIEVGQEVSLSASDIKNAVAKAISLSSAEQVAWQVYANNVVF